MQTFEDKENTKITFEKPYEELGSMANISKANKENNEQVSPTADLDIIELSTPVHDEDSDKSVVEETPQKYVLIKSLSINYQFFWKH